MAGGEEGVGEEGASRGGGEVMVPPPLPQNDGEMRCGRRRVGRGGKGWHRPLQESRGMVAVMEGEEGVSRGGGEVMVPPPLPQNDGEMRCGQRRVGRGGRRMASRR